MGCCHSLVRLCLPVRDLIRCRSGIVVSSSFIRLLSTGCHASDDEEAWLAPPGHIRSLRRKQQAGWIDKTGTKVLRFSVKGQMILSICPQRQILRPIRRNRHEPAGFLQRALTDGHLNDNGVSLTVLSWTETVSLLPEPDGHLSMYPALQLPMHLTIYRNFGYFHGIHDKQRAFYDAYRAYVAPSHFCPADLSGVSPDEILIHSRSFRTVRRFLPGFWLSDCLLDHTFCTLGAYPTGPSGAFCRA